MLATGLRHFHLLSVDAKDQELEILQTLPLHIFTIDVITVEFSDGSEAQGPIISHLNSVGYVALHHFVNHPYRKSDLIFARKELVHWHAKGLEVKFEITNSNVAVLGTTFLPFLEYDVHYWCTLLFS